MLFKFYVWTSLLKMGRLLLKGLLFSIILTQIVSAQEQADPLAGLTVREKRLVNEILEQDLPKFLSNYQQYCGYEPKMNINWVSFTGVFQRKEDLTNMLFTGLAEAMSTMCRLDYAKRALRDGLQHIKISAQKDQQSKVLFNKAEKTLEIYIAPNEVLGGIRGEAILNPVEDAETGLNFPELRILDIILFKALPEYQAEFNEACQSNIKLEINLDSFRQFKAVESLDSAREVILNNFIDAMQKVCGDPKFRQRFLDNVKHVEINYVPSPEQRKMDIKDGVFLISVNMRRATSFGGFLAKDITQFLELAF
jgi:hypothetical protein